IQNAPQHANDLVRLATTKFACTRQAMHKHVQNLLEEGVLTASGSTRSRTYTLSVLSSWRQKWQLTADLSEDRAWSDSVGPRLADLADNLRGIWLYVFSELMNNAIDHSLGTSITVSLRRTGATTEMTLQDNGVGIFKKIQMALNLPNESLAGIELAKGKFTTDPAKHSGQGIFFSSRMLDEFSMVAGEVELSRRHGEPEQWRVRTGKPAKGTTISLVLANHSKRTTKSVFDRFSTGEDYAFSTTSIPVRLLQEGRDQLVSRSQAKRLLARAEQFTTVILDFSGVDSIGQAFADEAFRVFQNHHRGTKVQAVHANAEVTRMMRRALAAT
ncbi:MAG: DUF4325 domain-containing protein, partial [Planctomycetota bacterium]